MENCQLCGSPTKFKQGVKKETGREWKGYFCTNPDCKNVEWVGTQGSTQKRTTEPIPASGDFKFENFVADEFAGLNKRFDDMAKYLQEKLEKKSG